MQRLPSILTLLLVALGAGTAVAGGDQVFHLTRHGNTTTSVNRITSVPTGHCSQCHVPRQSPAPMSPVLFSTNTNALCFTCHAAAGSASAAWMVSSGTGS